VPTKRKTPLTLDPAALKVMTIPEWCKLMDFSYATGKRIIARGDGPPIIQLSTKRRGIRVFDAAQWQEARMT
jgi:hypothetical protein